MTEPVVVIRAATPADIRCVAAVQGNAARSLGARYGAGPWAHAPTERAIGAAMRHARVLVGLVDGAAAATFRLGTRKPWAIDVAYFTTVARPLYLTDMAVQPEWQGRGVGRACLQAAVGFAREWPADAIRLDAYDAAAGAGGFYARCGYQEVGRTSYRGNPLVYFERLIQPRR